MSRIQAAFLVVMVGISLLAAPVRAQTDDESRRELAKQLFLQANEDAQAGRFRAAIQKYEKAIKLAPKVSALYRNLAVVYEKIDRCDKAIPLFDRYIELRPDAGDAEAVAQARDRCREELKERPGMGGTDEDGTLALTCNVEGAKVEVDGVFMGSTPLEPLNLKAGTYNVLVVKKGYEPWQRRIPIQGGRDVVISVTLVVEKTDEEGPKEAPHLVWKWVTIGTGAALVATGVGLTVAAEMDRVEFEDVKRDDAGVLAISQSRAKELEDSVNTKRTASFALYGIGGAAVLGGVLWLVLDQPEEPTDGGVVAPAPVSMSPVPGGGILTFTGSF